MWCRCCHHRLYLLQCTAKITVVLLRRGGRFSVERSPCDNLVDNDTSTRSPQWLPRRVRKSLRYQIISNNTYPKYRARVSSLMRRCGLIRTHNGHHSRQALGSGARILQTERGVQLDGSTVRQTMGEMPCWYVRIGSAFEGGKPRFELIDALVDRDKIRIVRVNVWNFFQHRGRR